MDTLHTHTPMDPTLVWGSVMLMPSQRLTHTTAASTATPDTDTAWDHMDTPAMPSPPTPLTEPPMATDTHTPTDPTAAWSSVMLMLSPRLMPTTPVTTDPQATPAADTGHTDTHTPTDPTAAWSSVMLL